GDHWRPWRTASPWASPGFFAALERLINSRSLCFGSRRTPRFFFEAASFMLASFETLDGFVAAKANNFCWGRVVLGMGSPMIGRLHRFTAKTAIDGDIHGFTFLDQVFIGLG